MQVINYSNAWQREWNKVVKESRNATFLFDRNYMEYHADRFTDASLIFLEKERIVALFPASIKENRIVSHGGLTYGGLILPTKTTTTEVLTCYSLLKNHYKSLEISEIICRPIPAIYHCYPCEEELYALFRNKAVLTERKISSAIDMKSALPLSELRKRKVKRALKAGVTVNKSDQLNTFHAILADVLMKTHGVRPVHTVDELHHLAALFTTEIQLFTATINKEIVAGALLYISTTVVHVQYIAASESGKACGALDLLFYHLIHQTEWTQRWFDFGISTEEGGLLLNEGLIFQKETLGGRGIVYDTYKLSLVE